MSDHEVEAADRTDKKRSVSPETGTPPSKLSRQEDEKESSESPTPIPVPIKDDKDGLGSVVAKHYNELEEKGLAARVQSRIFYMRNLNNWIKSMVINDVVKRFRDRREEDLVVLDMCCGKGGDILKWVKSNAVRHMIFADIAQTSVEQCEERYKHVTNGQSRQGDSNPRYRNQRRNERHFTAEFITADCTKERLREKYSDPKIEIDLVSVQFSFHYSFESLPQAQMMLQNISENLKPGGFFIGTTPNANRIVKKFRNAGNEEFGNEVFRIRFESSEPFPLFGAKYYFQLEEVVNCPEFLVQFPCLEELAEKCGLKLLFKYTFDEFFTLKMKDGHFLLERMQALETYPQFHGDKLSSENDLEYCHAKKFTDENPDSRRFGTLSKSEWEAVSLYLVFAFVKVA